jgi:hypothetical protein
MNLPIRQEFAAVTLLLMVACAAPAPAAPGPEVRSDAGVESAISLALDRLDPLLQRYVEGTGVRYAAWRASSKDRRTLDGVVEALEELSSRTLSASERAALQINLYNTVTLRLVLDGDPKNSIRDLSKLTLGFGIFHAKRLDFDGERISLDSLEDQLRAESQDPRVHFAVNCASNSCPALLNEAFRSERLEQQLEQQSHAFLMREDAIRLGSSTLELSKIFDWYADDFGGQKGVLEFIGRYAPTAVGVQVQARGEELRIKFMSYDWNLNRLP